MDTKIEYEQLSKSKARSSLMVNNCIINHVHKTLGPFVCGPDDFYSVKRRGKFKLMPHFRLLFYFVIFISSKGDKFLYSHFQYSRHTLRLKRSVGFTLMQLCWTENFTDNVCFELSPVSKFRAKVSGSQTIFGKAYYFSFWGPT